MGLIAPSAEDLYRTGSIVDKISPTGRVIIYVLYPISEKTYQNITTLPNLWLERCARKDKSIVTC
jgi:hypothetical protein